MRRRWLYVGVAGLGVGVAAGAVAAWATCDCTKLPVEAMAARVIAGLAFINVGIVALRRRGSGRVGALMCGVGFAWFIDDLSWIYAPLPSSISHFGAALFQPMLAHLTIAFPSGRLRARLDRWVVGSVYVAWLVLTLALLSVWDPADAGCPTCPRNLLMISRAPQVHDVLDELSTGITLILAALVVGVVLRHWMIASAPARRALAPVLWASAPLAGVVVEYSLVGRSYTPAGAPLALAALPIGFLVGLLRISLSRAAVGRLVIELGDSPPAGWRPTQLRDALARTLDDPSLQVAYWLPEQQLFVDPAGIPVQLPDERDSDRVTTLLERGGKPIAALIHDVAVRDDPELVEAVGAAARLAIENGRLEAEIRAQLQEVRASRTRLVEAAGAERRRIERNLHDGSQQRLVNLALALSMAQSRLRPDVDAELAGMLSEAAQELKLALAGAARAGQRNPPNNSQRSGARASPRCPGRTFAAARTRDGGAC